MGTVLTLKSWRDLTNRKARAVFSIATIAAAVVGLWLFAVPTLIDQAMDERVESDLLWDMRVSPNGVELSDADIAAIRNLANVAGVEARATVNTRVQGAGREFQAWLVGVDDFSNQEVNAVNLSSGEMPAGAEVLTDPQNDRTGRYPGAVGDRLTIAGRPHVVSGVGSTLEFSATVDDEDPVFYLPLDRLQGLFGFDQIFWIDLRLDGHQPAEVAQTADAVREYLGSIDAELTYWDPVKVREPGSWPEKESFDTVLRLTYVIALLGMLSALLMVYTTMNTIVREQTTDIGVLKAVGAGRRAIVRSYLLTAALLGGIGTTLGTVVGVYLSNLLVRFTARQFSGVEAGFGLPAWVLLLSIVVGLGGTMLAALPAVRRATAVPVRDALVDHGVSGSFGRGKLDAALRRLRSLPAGMRMGLRNAARHKGRTAVTATQIGFAVGTFLGFMALGITIMSVTAQSFDGEGGDIWVRGGGDAAATLGAVPGVADVVPVYYADVTVGDDAFDLQGQTPGAAVFHDDLRAGRWFTEAEEAAARPVVVLGPVAANATGADVGDALVVETVTGRTSLEVVGIDTLMVEDGEAVFTPLSTAKALGGGGLPGAYYVLTSEADESFIDGVAAEIQRTLDAGDAGFSVETRYIEREAELSQNRVIVALLLILGVPVIAIGMIGLVNTMTTNILERTREIGVLRAVGARARHIRRIIHAEALLLGLVGWVVAIPIGYVIGQILTELMSRGFRVDFDMRFPVWPIVVALVVTVVITSLVVRLPVRRATRLPPGTALRYE